MGVYTRFKKNPDGFRQLVELLETTPTSRRQKMIDVGMEEDPDYTQRALQYMMNFEDILKLPDLELAEVIAQTPPRMTGYAIHAASPETKAHFLSKSLPKIAAEIKEALDTTQVSSMQIGGAQMKMIEAARKLEKKGIVKSKRIPTD